MIIILAAACSGELSESDKLEGAREAISSNEPKAALIHLKNLLKDNANHGEARALLGQVQLELGEPASAEKELISAQRLGVQDNAVFPALAEALLLQGKYEEVLALSPPDTLSRKNQGATLTILAKALLALGKTAAASELLESALPLDPGSAETKTTQVAITANDDPDSARGMLDEILTEHPDHAPAWMLLGNLERAANNPQSAESAFSNAIKYDGSGRDYMSRALVRIQLGNIEGAQDDVDKASALLPQYHELDFLRGLLHIKRGNLEEAKSSLDAAFQANSQFLPTRIYLAEVNFKLGNLAQAESLAASYISQNPDYTPANTLYAAILLKSGRYAEAESLAGFAIDRLPDDIQTLSILADALRGQANRRAEIDVLLQIQALQPENQQVVMRLGSAYIVEGDEETGLQLLNSALDKDSALLEAAKELVAYYSRRGMHDKAIEIAENFQAENNDMAEAHNITGLAYTANNDLVSAEDSFQTASSLSPGDPFANQNIAAIRLRSKNYNAARESYETVLKHYPDHLQTLIKLSVLDQIEGRKEDMVIHLKQAITAHPQAVTPRILLARHFLIVGDPDKVAAVLREVLQNDGDNLLALELMGRTQMNQKDYAQATYNFEKLVKLQPDYAEGHFLLSQAYASKKDAVRVLAELNKTLELKPNHFLARLNMAQILYKQEEFPEAAKQLEFLKALAPENPDIQYLEATIARATGQTHEALRLFSAVLDSVSNTKAVISLAQQEWNMGDNEIAISRLENWLVEHPDDINTRLYLAKFYSRSSREVESNAQYQKVLESFDKNVIALNNLAWALRDSDPEKALEYAERSSEVAGSSRQVADTLAVVLMKNNELKSALRSSEQATSGMTADDGDPTMLFHKAQIMDALGSGEETVILLESLLQTSKDFPERTEAEAILARLQEN